MSAHEGGTILQQPVRGKYHYLFGDNILVAPICSDNLVNMVTLPEGSWRYFFNDKEIIDGPAIFENEFPMDEYPVYVRKGAIISMDIKRDYTGIGDKNSEGYLTMLIYPDGINEFNTYHPDKNGNTKILTEDSDDLIKISLKGLHKPHILTVNMNSGPRKGELDGKALSYSADFHFDVKRNKLIIKTDAYLTGDYVIYK